MAGTPGGEFRCPPKLVEVTDAGVPLICAFAAGAKARKTNPPTTRARAATVAEFSRFTYESYPSFETMAQAPPEQKLLYMIRAWPSSVGLPIFCQFAGILSA